MKRLLLALALLLVVLGPTSSMAIASRSNDSGWMPRDLNCQPLSNGGWQCLPGDYIFKTISAPANTSVSIHVSFTYQQPGGAQASANVQVASYSITVSDTISYSDDISAVSDSSGSVRVQLRANGSVVQFFGPGLTGEPQAYLNLPATSTPSPVPTTAVPTSTPVPPTNTPGGPTDTITTTPVDTATPGTTPDTATPTVSGTPGPVEEDCGDWSFPLLNCNNIGANPPAYPYHWADTAGGTNNGTGPWVLYADSCSGNPGYDPSYIIPGGGWTCYYTGSGTDGVPFQAVTAQASGELYIQVSCYNVGAHLSVIIRPDFLEAVTGSADCTSYSLAGQILDLGVVTAGITYDVTYSGSGTYAEWLRWRGAWVGDSSGTPVPSATGTPANTSTPYNSPTVTATVGVIPPPPQPVCVASDGVCTTPVPTEPPLPTPTPCPTGCFQVTVPITPTAIVPETGWLSPLLALPLARPACEPLGNAPIFVPVFGTGPISYTMTITHTSLIGFKLADGTTFDPCHQVWVTTSNEIWWGWNIIYWLQVIAIAIAGLTYELRWMMRLFS